MQLELCFPSHIGPITQVLSVGEGRRLHAPTFPCTALPAGQSSSTPTSEQGKAREERGAAPAGVVPVVKRGSPHSGGG